MNVERISRNVIKVNLEASSGFEKWFLLSSDRHHDSAHADHSLEKLHLDMALARNAHVLDFGDLFDAMQGKQDKRSSYTDLRPEFLGRSDYYDAITEYNAKFYKPYANIFLVAGRGNHESKVSDKAGTDLTSNLVMKLNEGKTDPQTFTHSGGYGGWVKFQFTISKTQKQSYNLKYMHGWGGGGPVTRGVIDTNRQAVYLPDADIVVNGHTHDNYYMPVARERITQKGEIHHDLIHFIRTPSYKNDFGDGSGGWHVETGKPPKPRGCVWMRFFFESNRINLQFQSDVR